MIPISLAFPTVATLLTLLAFMPRTTSARRLQFNGTATEGIYFYSFYAAKYNQDTYLDTIPGGSFEMQWREASKNVVGGVGWELGTTDRRIEFGITQFDVHEGQNQTVAIYGWMRDDDHVHSGVVEYYVVEDFRNWNARSAGAIPKGSREVDGGWYDYYEAYRVNSPQAFSPENINFTQYWAVRQQPRQSGIVDMRKHFDNWEDFELFPKPTHFYQILAVEGYNAQGFAQGYARVA